MTGLTSANVRAGGAVINTNGFNVAISQSLAHDPTGPATDGGLVKNGAGTLTLNGASLSYTGVTTVNAAHSACKVRSAAAARPRL